MRHFFQFASVIGCLALCVVSIAKTIGERETEEYQHGYKDGVESCGNRGVDINNGWVFVNIYSPAHRLLGVFRVKAMTTHEAPEWKHILTTTYDSGNTGQTWENEVADYGEPNNGFIPKGLVPEK